MTATTSIVLPAGGALAGAATQKASGRVTAVIAVGAITAAAVMDGLNAIIFDIAGEPHGRLCIGESGRSGLAQPRLFHGQGVRATHDRAASNLARNAATAAMRPRFSHHRLGRALARPGSYNPRAVSSLVYVLVEGSRWDWFEDSKIVWLSLIAGTTLIGFIFWQHSVRNRSPLIDLKIFRHEEFAFGFAVSFVAGFAVFGSAFLIPAFTLVVLQFSARDAGLVLLPSALTVGLGLLTSGSLIQFLRAPPVVIVPFGITIFMTAMWLLSGSNTESGYPDLVPTLVLRGFGMGLLFIAITIICLSDLKGTEIPHGVGLFNLGRQMGGLIGIAFLSTFLDHHMALRRTVIVSNLGEGSPVVTQALQGMEQGFASRGMAQEQATSAALAAMDRMVTGQAAAISFNEAFLSLALLFVAAVP